MFDDYSRKEILPLYLHKKRKYSIFDNLNNKNERNPFWDKNDIDNFIYNSRFFNDMYDDIISETVFKKRKICESSNDISRRSNNIEIYQPCIIDSHGEAINKDKTKPQILVTEINDQLLFTLCQNPNLLYSLTPYNFECVIAKIFEKNGYSVKITPKTRDGGKDIFIAKNELCSFLFYVECKKYSPNNHVGIDIIQRLYGVVTAEKATGGIVATTSYFTQPAKDYIQKNQINHQITLHDYDSIINNLKSLKYD